MTHRLPIIGIAVFLACSVLPACSRSPEAAPAPAALAEPASAVGSPIAAASAASPGAAKAGVSNRKIIRQAELELLVGAPGTTQTAIEHLAEAHGGYVVSAARDTDNGSQINERVTVTVRVPQAELTQTIGEVKRLGRGTGSERITSDDVTDEYVDLGARMVSQRSLEQQYLEILKRAVTVKDAMEVQKELAEVRTEIERMQGRQQLLDKESAFSTLTVHLTATAPKIAVSAPGFGGTLSRAWADSVSLSADLISGGIRLCGFLLPVLLILVLPSVLGVWALIRGARYLSARKSRRLLAEAT